MIRNMWPQHGHRFDECKDHILGLGPDATPKTPALGGGAQPG